MDLDNLFRMANNFIHTHTYVVIGIVAALVIITFWKPKQMGKLVLLILGAIAVIYILSLIGGALWSGFSDKGHMLNKY